MDRHWPYTVLRAHCRLRRPGSWRCHGSWSESSTRKESCDHRLHSLVCRESQIGHKTAECTRSDALADIYRLFPSYPLAACHTALLAPMLALLPLRACSLSWSTLLTFNCDPPSSTVPP